MSRFNIESLVLARCLEDFVAGMRSGAGVLCIYAVARISRRTRRDIVCHNSHSGEVVVDRSPHRSLCACRIGGRFPVGQRQ